MNTVVGIGAALFDMLSFCDSFPEEDTKMCSSQTVLQGGGPCATAMVAVRKLGVASGYAGVVGDDVFGEFIRHDFERYGVDISALHTKKGFQSPHSTVLCSKERASRTCVWNPGNLPEITADEFDIPKLLQGTKILHLDGYHRDLALAAADYIHKQGGLVSMDAGTMRPRVGELLSVTDILIASEEFAKKLTGKAEREDTVRALGEMYHPRFVAVTCGKDGGVLLQGGDVLHYRPFMVDAVDTNGAGDVFHGAFLVGWLKGFSPYDCCLFASAVSALKCTVRGAREGVPSYERAMKFLAGNSITIHKG